MSNKNTLQIESPLQPEEIMQSQIGIEHATTPISELISSTVVEASEAEDHDNTAHRNIVVASLMRQYLVGHAERKGVKAINTAEKFHDWVDVFNAHEAMYPRDQYGHNIQAHIPFSSDKMLQKLIPGIGRDEAAVDSVAEDVNSLSKYPNREMRKALMRSLDLKSVQMAGFVVENLDQETRDSMKDVAWAQLELGRRVLPYDSEEYEQDIPNFLSQITHGSVDASLLLPAIRNYYSGEYPKDLLGSEKRPPDYADSVTSLLMFTLKGMAKEDKNARVMYGLFLQAGSHDASGKPIKISEKEVDGIKPTVGALVAVANNEKLLALLSSVGKVYDPIKPDSGDMQFPEAISRIAQVLSIATDSPDMSLHLAQKSKNALECVQLVNGRLVQYMEAKAEQITGSKQRIAQRNGTIPKVTGRTHRAKHFQAGHGRIS